MHACFYIFIYSFHQMYNNELEMLALRSSSNNGMKLIWWCVRTYFLPRRFAQLTNLHSTFTHFHTSSGLLDLFPLINLYELTFRNHWITAKSCHSMYGLSWKSYMLCGERMLIWMFRLLWVELLYGVCVCWSSFVRYIIYIDQSCQISLVDAMCHVIYLSSSCSSLLYI